MYFQFPQLSASQMKIGYIVLSLICVGALFYMVMMNSSMYENVKTVNSSGLVEDFRGMSAVELMLYALLVAGAVGGLVMASKMTSSYTPSQSYESRPYQTSPAAEAVNYDAPDTSGYK